jgi:hypothetical protein
MVSKKEEVLADIAAYNKKEVSAIQKSFILNSLKSITMDTHIPEDFKHIGSIRSVYPELEDKLYRADIWENSQGLRIATWDQGNGHCDFMCEGTIEELNNYANKMSTVSWLELVHPDGSQTEMYTTCEITGMRITSNEHFDWFAKVSRIVSPDSTIQNIKSMYRKEYLG